MQVAAGKKPMVEEDIAELKKFRSWYKGSLITKVPGSKPAAGGLSSSNNAARNKNSSIASAGQLKPGGPLKTRTEFLLARIEEVKFCCSKVCTVCMWSHIHTLLPTFNCRCIILRHGFSFWSYAWKCLASYNLLCVCTMYVCMYVCRW